MANQISLVTAPDDVAIDGTRVLLVDLDEDQTALVSECLNTLENFPNIVVYMWKTGNNADWLFDKKNKSNIIIFNANSQNDIIIGYLAAQKNSYYFGTLRILEKVNNSAIYNTDQCSQIFENLISNYGTK